MSNCRSNRENCFMFYLQNLPFLISSAVLPSSYFHIFVLLLNLLNAFVTIRVAIFLSFSNWQIFLFKLAHFQKRVLSTFFFRAKLLIFYGPFVSHEPSLGSCELPQKTWARSNKPCLTFIVNKKTDRQAKYDFKCCNFINFFHGI